MLHYKLILKVFALIFLFPVVLTAQEKELVVKYKYERDWLHIGGENNSELIKGGFNPYYVNVYAFGNVSIRETDLVVGGVGMIDSTYNYLKVDYSKAHLLEPVVQISTNGTLEYLMLLEEPLNFFEWKLANETKTILGYNCTQATCTYRGRNYVAYFTREIPFKAAPWKFYGLPGVILEVYSTDDLLRWTAKSMDIRLRNAEMELPYSNLEPINLEQYVDFLRKRKQEKIEHARRGTIKNSDRFFNKYDKESELNAIEFFEPGLTFDSFFNEDGSLKKE